jgi:hemerythrin
VFRFLQEYVDVHFAMEETHMRQHNFSEEEMHVLQHRFFASGGCTPEPPKILSR